MSDDRTRTGLGVDSKGDPVVDPTRNVLSSLQALTSPSQAAVYYGKACAAGFEPGCREEKAAARPD